MFTRGYLGRSTVTFKWSMRLGLPWFTSWLPEKTHAITICHGSSRRPPCWNPPNTPRVSRRIRTRPWQRLGASSRGLEGMAVSNWKKQEKKWENLGNQATIAHVLTTVFLVSPLRRNELTNRIRGIRQDMRELEQQAWRIKQSISKSWIVVSRCLRHLSGSKKIGLFFKSQANWSIDTGTCESVCSNQAHLGKRSQTH